MSSVETDWEPLKMHSVQGTLNEPKNFHLSMFQMISKTLK